jgi:hypothetical protein
MVPIWSLISVPPLVRPRLAELKEMSPLHGLGHLIMDQSYVCALIAMMVRNSPSPKPPPSQGGAVPPLLPTPWPLQSSHRMQGGGV